MVIYKIYDLKEDELISGGFTREEAISNAYDYYHGLFFYNDEEPEKQDCQAEVVIVSYNEENEYKYESSSTYEIFDNQEIIIIDIPQPENPFSREWGTL